MTSITWVLGGRPIPERQAVGAMVRQFAARLEGGHVEATVRIWRDQLLVEDAIASPLTARERNVRADLQTYLNTVRP